MDLYIFAGIGLFGFLLILISFVMGEIGHVADAVGGHDVHLEHDLGTGDPSAGHDIHAGDVGHAHEHVGEASHGDGPGPFSTRVLSIFLTTFGTVAAGARAAGLSSVSSAALGLAAGYGLGWCAWRLIRFFYAQGASSGIRARDLEGCTGEVTVAIPAMGPGQVACILDGSRTYQIAWSETGEEIGLGAAVRIVRVTPEGVRVEPASGPSRQDAGKERSL